MLKEYAPRQFPVIAQWTNELVQKRVEDEENGSGFGNVQVLDRLLERNTNKDELLVDFAQHIVETHKEKHIEQTEQPIDQEHQARRKVQQEQQEKEQQHKKQQEQQHKKQPEPAKGNEVFLEIHVLYIKNK